MQRDRWVCQICLLPIPPSAEMGNLRYGNVDHIVPSSKGGPADDSNFQAAHAVCNSIKGDKDDTFIKETMRSILQDIVRSIDYDYKDDKSSTREIA
jgi:5-methylcytosine-specific restriction endonuclease McrA